MDKIGNFLRLSRSARWQTNLEFDDIWCGSSWTQSDLGGLLWHHCCVFQWHRNFLPDRNFIFAMLRLEIAPDNAATGGFSLEYSW